MAENFFPARGCVYRHPYGDSDEGLYSVPGLKGVGGPNSPVLITGIDLSLSDVFLPISTSENFNIIYSFGQNFGNVQISGEILLGEVTNGGGGVTQRILKWFESKRISKTKTPLEVSIDSEAYLVYITGMALGAPNAEFNIQPFVFIGTQVGKPS
jgi:hypothetical protein